MADYSLETSQYDDFLYRGQFFVSTIRIRNADDLGFLCLDLENIIVYWKPELSIAHVTGAGGRVVSLGEVADPSRPSLTNETIVAELANAASWPKLEADLDDLTGRWVLIVTLGKETRIYHDAAGMRSVHHYVDAADGAVYAGSQPNLFRDLLGVERDAALVAAYERGPVPRSSGWPGETTPVVGVRRLLPNHYLDWATGRSERYWPREPIANRHLEEASEETARLLTGGLEAAVSRGEVWLPLSGGYDSRIVFACAKPFWNQVHFVNTFNPQTPRYDRDIPQILTRLAGRELTTVEYRPPDDAFLAICHRNAGNMFRDGHASDFYSLFRQLDFAARTSRPLFAFGHVAELARCYYYKDGVHPADVGVDLLCAKSRYFSNEIARSDYADWLSRFPRGAGIDVLDLFYWECRMGTWGTVHNAYREAFLESMPPFNCRRLLTSALGLEAKYRRTPHALFRQVLRIAEPRSQRFPFNESRLNNVLKWPIRQVPPPLRTRAQHLGRSVLSLTGR